MRVTTYSFVLFIRKHVNTSVLLLAATLGALIIANSCWADWYANFWQKPVFIGVDNFNLFSHGGKTLTLGGFINDALMAVFFLSVGLEIKREILCGELSSPKKALAPVIGACGGMLMPVVLFGLICPDNPDMQRGIAIPMATDIAFSLGCLSIFYKRCPISLKIFLAALAVADDLGGIIVIAIRYTDHLSLLHLSIAAGIVAVLLAGNNRNIRSKSFYLSLGIVLWYFTLNSGIHATIAGVVLAFCIPANVPGGTKKYIDRIHKNLKDFPVLEATDKPVVLSHEDISALKCVETASDHLISPLQDIEDTLGNIVNYFIIPLFAFASAGINFTGMTPMNLISGVGLSVFLGLLVGKFVGVFGISWLCIKLGIVQMPRHATWASFASICMICGIGFTVSMFMANLSYPGAQFLPLLNDAKLGILGGSIASAIIGCIMLHFTLPSKQKMARLKAEDEAAGNG